MIKTNDFTARTHFPALLLIWSGVLNTLIFNESSIFLCNYFNLVVTNIDCNTSENLTQILGINQSPKSPGSIHIDPERTRRPQRAP